MPFASDKQRKWMWANDPEMAKRWSKETPKGKKLPEYVGDKKVMKHAFDAAYVQGKNDALQKFGGEPVKSWAPLAGALVPGLGGAVAAYEAPKGEGWNHGLRAGGYGAAGHMAGATALGIFGDVVDNMFKLPENTLAPHFARVGGLMGGGRGTQFGQSVARSKEKPKPPEAAKPSEPKKPDEPTEKKEAYEHGQHKAIEQFGVKTSGMMGTMGRGIGQGLKWGGRALGTVTGPVGGALAGVGGAVHARCAGSQPRAGRGVWRAARCA